MKTAKKTISRLLSGIFVLLATLAFSIPTASAGNEAGTSEDLNKISEKEISTLLTAYDIFDENIKIQNITVKIYSTDDNLVYSAEVCQQEFDCDKRLNFLINQSDFLTEIDNTRIYMLNK